MTTLPTCKLLMNHASVERGLSLLAPLHRDFRTLDTARREHLITGLGPLHISLMKEGPLQHWLDAHGLFPWQPAPFDLSLIPDMTAYFPLYTLNPAWGVILPDDWRDVYYAQRGLNRNPHQDLGQAYDVQLLQEHL